MKNYFLVSAFNSTPKEKIEMFKKCEEMKKSCWLPESVAVAGDYYVFYDDIEDLGDIGIGSIYRYVREYGNHEGHWHIGHKMRKMNYLQITQLLEDYKEINMDIEVDCIFNYIKENWGHEYVFPVDEYTEIERSPFEDMAIEELFSDYWVAMASKQIDLANEILIYVKENFEKK